METPTPKPPKKRTNVKIDHRLPAVVQLKHAKAALDEVQRQAAKMRVMLWMAVHKAGGRIEMTTQDYQMAMQMPPEDSIVSVELSRDKKTVALILTDEEGERLPESEPKLVIATDA